MVAAEYGDPRWGKKSNYIKAVNMPFGSGRLPQLAYDA